MNALLIVLCGWTEEMCRMSEHATSKKTPVHFYTHLFTVWGANCENFTSHWTQVWLSKCWLSTVAWHNALTVHDVHLARCCWSSWFQTSLKSQPCSFLQIHFQNCKISPVDPGTRHLPVQCLPTSADLSWEQNHLKPHCMNNATIWHCHLNAKRRCQMLASCVGIGLGGGIKGSQFAKKTLNRWVFHSQHNIKDKCASEPNHAAQCHQAKTVIEHVQNDAHWQWTRRLTSEKWIVCKTSCHLGALHLVLLLSNFSKAWTFPRWQKKWLCVRFWRCSLCAQIIHGPVPISKNVMMTATMTNHQLV